MVEGIQRCQWHFVRERTLTAWKDGLKKEERTSLRDHLKQIAAMEIPALDIEMVWPEERAELAQRIRMAQRDLSQLATYFEGRGYVKVCKYLTRAQERVFTHLEEWLETGIVGHRTTFIIESTIRELVRRLKKPGWNWSDPGAERMGRIVILRRYDDANWEAYWRERLGLQDRGQMEILSCRKAA